MKIKVALLGLFFGQVMLAQNAADNLRTLEWASYHYMNQNYDKALSFFLKVGDTIPLAYRRNFSKVYAELGEIKKAAQTLRPLVDSDSAEVKDYYYFASYLTDNKKLRDEYRQKAIRLPIETKFQKDIPAESSYQLVPLSLNTEGPEFGAHLMEFNSNKVLVYSQKQSNKYTKSLSKKIGSDHNIFNLYQAQWDSKNFKVTESKPLPLGINSVFQDGPSSWDSKEEILYLTRSAQITKKQKSIPLYIYAWSSEERKKQVAVPLSINSDGHSTLHPAVSINDRKLYFASDRPGGFGGMDLYYVTILGNGNYSSAVNLGPDINTASDEIFPFVHQEKFLFYSAKGNNGKLSPKLAVNNVDVRWHVMDLPPPFASNQDDFSLSVDENLDYGLLSSNREIGKGDDDLYAFKFTPQMAGLEDEYSYNPIDTLVVSQEGVLKNDEASMLSQDPLTILFRKEAVLVENTLNGALQLNANGSFLYKNNAPMQEKDSFAYVLKSKYGTSKVIKVLLKRSEVAIEKLPDSLKETFLPIFYPYDKSNLLVDYKDRVDAVVSAMNARPEMIVELSSFSDCRGRKEYNLKLSQERTQTIIDYVRERIDNQDRIFGKGYGEATVSGNTTLDYLILGGSYVVYDNALLKQKTFNDLGYKAEIEKTNKGLYRVIVEQTNSYAKAQDSVQALKKQQQKVWIKSCECCSLTEEEHLQNRRTDFKIIRY